jgi:hypothetical protein
MGEEDPLRLIGSIPGLKRAERDMIEGGNAARLLKIKRLPGGEIMTHTAIRFAVT